MVTKSLEEKLAAVVFYLMERRANRCNKDSPAFNSYLDDPEINQWVDEQNKKGQIRNTRFHF